MNTVNDGATNGKSRINGVRSLATQQPRKSEDRSAAKEKAKSVRDALKAKPSDSDMVIGSLCDVSPRTVAKYRAELEATSQIAVSETRTGPDGTPRRLPTSANRRPASEPASAAIWANTYVFLAVGLSCALNAHANVQHAPIGTLWLAAVLGVVVPILVLILGRVAGLLHKRQLGRLAYVVGAVGCGVLALSVVHCTQSISLLTGSDYALAGLLALGIDCGLVACEVAAIAAG
jgi:hypothetical protein